MTAAESTIIELAVGVCIVGFVNVIFSIRQANSAQRLVEATTTLRREIMALSNRSAELTGATKQLSDAVGALLLRVDEKLAVIESELKGEEVENAAIDAALSAIRAETGRVSSALNGDSAIPSVDAGGTSNAPGSENSATEPAPADANETTSPESGVGSKPEVSGGDFNADGGVEDESDDSE